MLCWFQPRTTIVRFNLYYIFDSRLHSKEVYMTLLIPKHILDWIDSKRGALSRQAYIINCIRKLKEIEEI